MKYTIKMSCGHEEEVEIYGASEDRERKIAYYKSVGLCRECYRERMEERLKETGFTFNVSVLPYIDEKSGSILLFAWFGGDTKPYKEEIKALGGYRWRECEAADEWYSVSRPKMCWGKEIKEDSLQEEAEKAVSIGAKSLVPDAGLFALAHYQMAKDRQSAWKKHREIIDAVPKPAVPDVLKGHKWNQKIYGKEGNYSVYPDGEKTSITDERAEEIRAYLKAKEEYQTRVEAIGSAQEP